MWLHVSSWFFNVLHVCVKLVNVELPTQNIPKLLIVAQAEMPFLKGIEVLPKEDAQVHVPHAMHVDACRCMFMVYAVLECIWSS